MTFIWIVLFVDIQLSTLTFPLLAYLFQIELLVEIRNQADHQLIIRSRRRLNLPVHNNRMQNIIEADSRHFLSFDVRAVCNDGYYGAMCSVMCKERNDTGYRID